MGSAHHCVLSAVEAGGAVGGLITERTARPIWLIVNALFANAVSAANGDHLRLASIDARRRLKSYDDRPSSKSKDHHTTMISSSLDDATRRSMISAERRVSAHRQIRFSTTQKEKGAMAESTRKFALQSSSGTPNLAGIISIIRLWLFRTDVSHEDVSWKTA